MTLRSFVDSTGKEWYAFDVIPRTQERRHYDRRSGAAQTVDENDEPDRRDGDRRLTVGGQPRLAGVSSGWLCFERSEGRSPERRRLSPIPDNWNQCSDADLEAYCQSARRVRAVKSGKARDVEAHPAERGAEPTN